MVAEMVATSQAPAKMAISPLMADRAVWARAYGRAVAEGLTATINPSGLSWSVKSYTLIEFWSAGGSWRDVVCNCRAGQAAIACKHAAMLIKTLSLGSKPLGRDVPVPAAVAPVSPWAGVSVGNVLARKGGGSPAPPRPAGPAPVPAPVVGEDPATVAAIAEPAPARGLARRPVARNGQTPSPFALEQARIGRELMAAKARANAAQRAEEAQIAAQLDPDNDCDRYESFADFING